MIELFKKGVLAGIGAAVVTKEMAQSTLNEWVEKGKISATEAQEMADKIVGQGREEFEKARSEMSKVVDEALSRAHLATRRDLQALEARVAALEALQAEEKETKKSKS